MIGLHLTTGKKPAAFVSVLTKAGDVPIGRVSVLTPAGSVDVFNAADGGALGASVSPILVTGAQASGSPIPITTAETEARAANGRAPLAFAWSGGGTGEWSITSPSSPRTAFTCTNVAEGETYTATFTVEITDARGRSDTASVNASVTNYGDLSRGYTLEP